MDSFAAIHNQLCVVYEDLPSYGGFCGLERLYEVKPADSKEADATAQTYFVPESKLERYLSEEFVYDSETGQSKDGPPKEPIKLFV